MAGETRGELAEAIAKVALELALNLQGSGKQVFWQKSPDGAVIKPDFTIGACHTSVESLILVNASESAKESDKKYWRNIGEIFDSKTRLPSQPSILNLVFRSEIKPELIRLSGEISDASCLVDRHPTYGAPISSWLDRNHATAPKSGSGRVALLESVVDQSSPAYDADFANAMDAFASDLSSLLFSRATGLDPLWQLCREDFLARCDAPVRTARETLLRRGLARWLVVEPPLREPMVKACLQATRLRAGTMPDYATALGMVREVIGAYEIPEAAQGATTMSETTSRDLRLAAEFFGRAAGGDTNKATRAINHALADAPVEMQRSAELIRSVPEDVKQWHSFVLDQWSVLCTAQGCYRLLLRCAADPTMDGAIPAASGQRVWLWDHLIAMVRTDAGRNNDFGYSAMTEHFKSHQSDRELRQLLGEVCGQLSGREKKTAMRWVGQTLPAAAEPGRRGFQDWLAGTKVVSKVIVAAFAYSISAHLGRIDAPEGLGLSDIIDAHAYNLWNKLLTHQDFEPLPALIETACGSTVARTSAPSVMAELAGMTVQDAGRMPVFAFYRGLIFWQSAHGSHVNDKRKELCGRARALKYTKTGSGFWRRNSAQRMLLVLDGEWRDKDLKVLYESGWDEIFYPDEMDALVASVNGRPA